MKKNICLSVLSLLLIFTLCFSTLACNNQPDLHSFVNNATTNLYYGENEELKLKGAYSFSAEKSGKTLYYFSVIILSPHEDLVTYSLQFNLSGKDYSLNFSLSPVSNRLTAKIEIPKTEFSAVELTVQKGSEQKVITITSILPKNCLDYKSAVNSLCVSQKKLIENYYENGVFNGKISARILDNKNEFYWYIGLFNSQNDEKAFLINAINGEVLAIRDIL